MGCCASTNACRPPKISASKSAAAAPNRCNNISKSPPPTHPISEDEEAVKEVLSETPKHFPILQDPRPIFPLPDFSIPHDMRPQTAARRNLTDNSYRDDRPEICRNQCDPTAITAAMAQTREINGGEFRQRSPMKARNRQFPGEIKRERIAGMSPGRRSEISPNRSGSARKRENGEVSGRRSRSPVLRTDATPAQAGLARTQSARKTGRSPGRAPRKVEEEKRTQNGWAPTSNESLENPLVSLECFIFL